jgi:hypothetical protein
MDPLQPLDPRQLPQNAGILADDEYQKLEVGFIRKRDGQLMYVKMSDLFRQFHTADFINNEIVLSGEVCQLNSFQKKVEQVTLSVSLNLNGGSGTYSVLGTVYNANHDFPVNKGTSLEITLTPDANSIIENVVDSNGIPYVPNTINVVSVPVNASMTLTISYKAKVI